MIRNPPIHELAQVTFQTDQPSGTLTRRMEGGRRTRGIRRRSFTGLSVAQIDQLTRLLGIVRAAPLERVGAPKP